MKKYILHRKTIFTNTNIKYNYFKYFKDFIFLMFIKVGICNFNFMNKICIYRSLIIQKIKVLDNDKH